MLEVCPCAVCQVPHLRLDRKLPSGMDAAVSVDVQEQRREGTGGSG